MQCLLLSEKEIFHYFLNRCLPKEVVVSVRVRKPYRDLGYHPRKELNRAVHFTDEADSFILGYLEHFHFILL